MKKLYKKRGFTLVECVVAMAVLAIMSLLLVMIMSITLNLRNHNMELEAGIDEQVQGLAVGTSTQSDAYTGEIRFTDSDGNDAGSIGGTDGNLNKVYVEGEEVQLGILGYEPDTDYFESSIGGSVGGPGEGPGSSGSSSDKVYGACKTTVYLSEQGKNPVYETVEDVSEISYYEITWRVRFSVTEYSAEKAVKIALPSGSYNIAYSASSGSCNVLKISENVVRIEPTASDYEIQVDISFKISDDDMYSSLSEYLGGSSSVTLNS